MEICFALTFYDTADLGCSAPTGVDRCYSRGHSKHQVTLETSEPERLPEIETETITATQERKRRAKRSRTLLWLHWVLGVCVSRRGIHRQWLIMG